MVVYGNPSAWVGLTIEFKTVGPVPVIVGTGILLLVGESTRGPSGEAIVMNSARDAETYFHSGDLKEAIELAFGNGCPVVYAIRVLGSGAAKATSTLDDGLTPTANDCLVLTAASEGNWGNSVIVTVATGDYNSTEVNKNVPGDGTVGPYYTANCDLVQSSTNWVKLDGVAKTIVYSSGSLEAGKVYVDTTNGSITFFAGQEPTVSQTISYSLKYHTKKITVTDNESTFVYNNLPSITHIIAKLNDSGFVVGDDVAGETHLPVNGTYSLTGGLNGSAITTDDWENILSIGGEAAALQVGGPTAVAITSYEVESATYDLVPVLDAFLTDMANDFHPCLGFVTMAPNATIAEALDLVSGYNNRLLTVVINGWDDSTTPQNIAVSRAAKECAVALGESTALAANAMNGLNGILNSFNQSETDVLTTGGVDVIIKKRGILPYIGISTATDWQYMRCVDNRTINFVIIACEYICRSFYHQKRTSRVLSSIKASIASMLDDLKAAENIRAYTLSVTPHATDTGRVNIDLQMENIGHIERFRQTLSVGILEGVE